MTPRKRSAESGLDRASSYEKSLVGALLECPSLFSQIGELTAGDFISPHERSILAVITKISSEGRTADLCTVDAELGSAVPPGYLVECTNGVVPECFQQYKREVLKASRDRQFRAHIEVLGTLTSPEELTEKLDEMRELVTRTGEEDWCSLFHSAEEFSVAAPLEFRINSFLQDAGITLIGGLSGHGKTLLMLSMVRSLLEGSPLFDYELFTVPAPVKRVVYLVPESALGPFWSRLKLFRLEKYAGNCPSGRLLVHTLSSRQQLSLSDPRLLKAVEGADVFLDTAVRFMDGSENDVEGTRPFADSLFRLLNVGARSICGAHHSPKSFSSADYMSLENILRGSGDLGAMLCTAWGVRQIDAGRNRIWVENCKPRDFQPCPPFILEGRPHIDVAGTFSMFAAPGTAGELKDHIKHTGRPETSDKADKLRQCLELRAEGKSTRDIADAVGIGKSTVGKWLFEYDRNNGREVTQ
jgi:hypothetical protein